MGLLDLLFGKHYTQINADELKVMLKEKTKYQFVDVRTKQEYKHRHIKGFDKNIDFYKFSRNHSMLDRISKEKPVVVICATGSRSRSTCNMLSAQGHTEIFNFQKGMTAWNGPTTK